MRAADHGIEIRQVAGGYRMSTKPEQHDVVRAFAKSLKPPIRLSLPALETLAVIAYKQPVTVPEISEIRGVDSSGVIATLLDRKLITTAGRKAVIGRPDSVQDHQGIPAALWAERRRANCPAWRSSKSWWRNRSRTNCCRCRTTARKLLLPAASDATSRVRAATVTAAEEEAGSAEPHAAGENDPAA